MFYLSEILVLAQWLFIFCLIFLILISPVIVVAFYFKRKTHNFGLKNKKNVIPVFLIILGLLVVTYLWILMSCVNGIYDWSQKSRLSKYESAFEYLQNYKREKGIYPSTLDFNKYVKKSYKYQTYETKDNAQEYIIKVSDYKYVHTYNYCSNPKYEECYPHDDYPAKFTAIGKWIEYENLD